MTWRIEVAPGAARQLAKPDKPTAKLITSWLRRNIDGCDDPRAHGKPLRGNLSGAWRYRVGDYRVLCEIQDGKMVALAVEVTHRGEVYGKKARERKH